MFEREPGYYVGAMYVSYVISLPTVLMLVWLLVRFGGASYGLALISAMAALLPFVPIVVRLSRVIWIHLDRTFDTSEE